MVVAGFEHEFAQIPESHRSGVELLLRQRLVTQTSSGKLVPSSDVIDSLGLAFSVTGRLTSRASHQLKRDGDQIA
jgi:hypothetical protein